MILILIHLKITNIFLYLILYTIPNSKLMSFNSLIIKIKSNTKDWLSNYLKAYDF